MATPYATWDDVVASYELPLPETDRPRIELLLRQASARLNAMAPSVPARIAAGTLDPDLPGGMVLEAVLRVFRNPSGLVQQTAGPYHRTWNDKGQRNDIYFDPNEVRMLLSPADDLSPGVGTFKMGRQAPVVPVTALDAALGYPRLPESYGRLR